MPIFRLGSSGTVVTQIQTALKAQNFYPGPIDGLYGGGTEAAVRGFQQKNGLTVDGIVGPATWQALIGAAPMPVPLFQPAIEGRCLALTGTFETNAPPPDCFACVTGNFDGMGISFGALQWNIGSGSLQPLLKQFDTASSGIVDQIFGNLAGELRAMLNAPLSDQLDWARTIQTSHFNLFEPWLGYFKTLGRTPAFIDIETTTATKISTAAQILCTTIGVTSQRALALNFDIMTQDGGISGPVMERIKQMIQTLPATLGANELEQAKLVIIANCRADAAKPEWREDVRTRKLTIAQGTGTVHGRYYDLAGQFGITLQQM